MTIEDPAVQLAVELQTLGVSQAGVVELLSKYPHEAIRKQLDWLPHRKAKRPEAFIIQAVRQNYSPPKEVYHAKTAPDAAQTIQPLDEGSELPPGRTPANIEGHRTPYPPHAHPADGGVEPGRGLTHLDIPET